MFGHHYLRPHETYHEPTRKFYVNEVVCAPLYEAVPCDLVAERCWVLDPHTFCKGIIYYILFLIVLLDIYRFVTKITF